METETGAENTNNKPEVQEQVHQGGESETVGALGALGAFMSEKTVNELTEYAKKAATETQTAEPAKKEDKKPDTVTSEEKKPEEKKPEPKKEEQEIKSVLGLNVKKDTKKAPEVVIENPEQILDVVKKDFGQEYKGIGELPKFFESAKKWRNDSQAYEKTKAEFDNIVAVLDETPSEIIEAMKLYHSGQDYMKAFENRPKFNLDLPVEKQDINELVKHYFPGKFANEDFEEENASPALEIAKQAAIDKYNYSKVTRDSQRADVEKRANDRLQNIKTSVDGSVNYLKQSFPDADEEAVTQISSTLEGGIQKVAELLYNNDGTVKQDAAKKLMMLLHGEQEISRMMKIAANQAESRANEDIVTRGADTPKPVKTGATADKISEGAMMQINHLRSFKTKPTF